MEISQASVQSSCPYHTTSSLPIPNHAINSTLLHVSAYISRRSGSFRCPPSLTRNAAEPSPRFRQCRSKRSIDRRASHLFHGFFRLFGSMEWIWWMACLSRLQERIAALCPCLAACLSARCRPRDSSMSSRHCTAPVAVTGQCDPSKCKRKYTTTARR